MTKDCGVLEALNVKVIGCGDRTLVLSHGFGGDQSVWNKILPSLSKKFKIIVFDMVFSGNVDAKHFDFERYTSLSAYAADLLTILEELKVEKCLYVGHSVSGMVGCIAAIQRPKLFEKLVLLCASPRYLNDESYQGGFEQGDIDVILSRIKTDYVAWVSSFASQVVGVDDPYIVKEYITTIKNMKPEIALAVAKTIFESDLRSILCEVKSPCSIIQTRKDIAVPTAIPYYMQGSLGGDMNTVYVLDIDGHLPQLTSPEMLVQVFVQVFGCST
ncbi:hypothetical protein SUGI_0006450 [Cryptomeria japonica]|uniref:probable strigolactone esterase DAD2 n=1 Tax=Cryptomeria japonica TaxID=3369 RepID=UPI002408C61F|nr:probable strigolactone esterase DAD2 [Cryptomeria japonica]GLJ04918.1 hypothetical protein SUGI_0006450 [Cryptomeria japonica]